MNNSIQSVGAPLRLTTANLGDSRAVLGRATGARSAMQRLSTDQTPKSPRERQRIVRAGAPWSKAFFPSPLSGEGPTTATKTPPPARGWAAGASCTFCSFSYGIFTASQISPKICKFHAML